MRCFLLLTAVLTGCATNSPQYKEVHEATSLLGAPLPRLEPSEEGSSHYEAELEAARERYAESGSELDAIWVGRHLAYLGRYQDAIDWYSDRLVDFPGSVRLLRHRGHRYLSIRKIDLAESDLSAAARAMRGMPDAIEPDGAPNPFGIPRSTTKTNVWYHLGLARYLLGDYEAAARVFSRCLALCRNDDMRVATLNWLVHSLRRDGQESRAHDLLAGVSRTMRVIENTTYLRLLLLQKGELLPEDVLDEEDGVRNATAAYGVATWSLCNGNAAGAEQLWRRIVAETPWNAFGHLCAEREVARLDLR